MIRPSLSFFMLVNSAFNALPSSFVHIPFSSNSQEVVVSYLLFSLHFLTFPTRSNRRKSPLPAVSFSGIASLLTSALSAILVVSCTTAVESAAALSAFSALPEQLPSMSNTPKASAGTAARVVIDLAMTTFPLVSLPLLVSENRVFIFSFGFKLVIIDIRKNSDLLSYTQEHDVFFAFILHLLCS